MTSKYGGITYHYYSPMITWHIESFDPASLSGFLLQHFHYYTWSSLFKFQIKEVATIIQLICQAKSFVFVVSNF